ncbi:cobalt-precorrin-6A reductase [Palleronia sp. KMU-117]|uniref:cobalt-precorrin-6A reductase n=1 Tax=Palleronia sp. KMU-117 TaxID=3434108 RepID=UPI003D71AEC1
MRLLLLAGTWEARQVAAALTRESRVLAIASLARAERRPEPFGIPTRIGGFGGDAGFVDWLGREGIDAIIDATHPFAARISHRTARIAAERGVDYIQFLRPAWLPEPGDDWTFLNTEADAPRHIPAGARVFLATGRRSLHAFGALREATLFCRRTDGARDPFPFGNGIFVYGRPPFSIDHEITTFGRLAIDWLVTRNSGGTASRAKLEAARELGVKVAMIRRPPQPPGPKVETVAEAMAWVRRRI